MGIQRDPERLEQWVHSNKHSESYKVLHWSLICQPQKKRIGQLEFWLAWLMPSQPMKTEELFSVDLLVVILTF